MKTKNIFTLMLLSLSLNVFAQNQPLPTVQPPKELISGEFSEGTLTRLSAKDIAQFIPWAQNAKSTFDKALKDAKTMPVKDRLEFIKDTIKNAVRHAGSKNYQMFMRFSLNRGLLLAEELEKQSDIDEIGVRENILNILVQSINVGLIFYETDLDFQNRAVSGNAKVTLDYAKFGTVFFKSMLPAVLSVFDASAEYRLLYKTFEMLNWDLSRDSSASNYSDKIIEIYNRLNTSNEYPDQDDVKNLISIRKLLLLTESVDKIKI